MVSGGAVGPGTAPQDVPCSIPAKVLENFQVTCFFCPHSVARGSTQPLISLGIKCSRHVELTSAVLLVLSFRVRMEAQHSIHPRRIHDLLQQSFTFLQFIKAQNIVLS